MSSGYKVYNAVWALLVVFNFDLEMCKVLDC